ADQHALRRHNLALVLAQVARRGPRSRARIAEGDRAQQEPGLHGWSYEGARGWDAVHGPTPGWDAAFLLIPWWMYEHHGDRRILERHYPGMRRSFDWLTSYADGHILDVGLGDWVAPGGDPPEGP